MCEFIKYYLNRLIRNIIDLFCLIIGVIYPQKRNYIPSINNAILLEPAISLSNKIKTGKLKSEDVVKAFINRINEVNPHINALIQDRFQLAIEEAKLIDQLIYNELSNGPSDRNSILSQPFLGVPFTAKDSVAITGLYFTSGCASRKGIVACEDSTPAANLKRSGAIPIGITNTPELQMWWNAENTLYGRSNNPYDKSRITGGSCGGESAIIASAGSVIGIGVDGGGAIRNAANFCGIYGHKTTPGVIPLIGHWPQRGVRRSSMCSFGPMCRYACDLRPLLKAMTGDRESLLKLDHCVDISKLIVYYISNYRGDPTLTQLRPEINDTIDKAINCLIKLGANVKEIEIPQLNHAFDIWYYSWRTDDEPILAEELTNRKGRINPWYELVKYMFGLSNHTLPLIISTIVENCSAHKEIYERLGRELRDEIAKLLGNDGILIYPSHPETAPKHNVTLFKYRNMGYNSVFNILNVAVTQIPMGLSDSGHPIGLQVIAGPYNDHLSIAIAEEFERHFGGWKPPS